MRVAVYIIPQHHRAKVTCDAMAAGAERRGEMVTRFAPTDFDPSHAEQFDAAVFYGYEGANLSVFECFKRSRTSRVVYVDLGYWGRRDGGRWAGYHKIVVDARHPTAYFRRQTKPHDRIGAFHVEPQPWRNGMHVLLAGMGDKGAQAEGFGPNQWEIAAVAEIRKYTTAPIIYRPKPSWKAAKPILGTAFSAPHARELADDLRDCMAVVTHHSNVAIDAVMAGVPAFCWGGVATELCSQDLSDLAALRRFSWPSAAERMQWAADLAYTQWNIAEMARGDAWNYLRRENLL